MTKFTRFSAPVAILAAIAIPVLTQGCSAADELCCSDPTKVTFDGEAGAQFSVAVSTAADLTATAQGAFDDVVNACRGIAVDLDASSEDQAAATAGADQAKAWCDLAVKQIKGKVTASGEATVAFTPPKCEASISAKANCQAKCSGGAQCDVQATPPTCEGGKLEVSCSGSCKADVGVEVACEGSCDAECTGSCAATVEAPSVDCTGKCEGTCEAKAGVGTGTGAQADGSCQGSCKGTCTAKPGTASIKCGGSCKGSCKGTCTAKAGATVKCDGKCEGKAEPISCKGGTLKGGCKVEAKCDANCEASASAKAECTPPALTITAAASVEARYIDSLRLNLPNLIVVLQARGTKFVELLGNASVNIAGSVSGDIGVKGIACLNTVVGGLANGATKMQSSVTASTSVLGSFKTN
jgi:hypothetical protein